MWKQLWNWVGRDWKNFGVNVRNMNVKDDSGESAELKKKRAGVRKLPSSYRIHNHKQNVEICSLRAILVRSQTKLTNVIGKWRKG